MTKEVMITVRGIQNGSDEETEPIETIATGEYYYKNDKHYILYDEVMEGETKPTKNRIKIASGHMELTKSGVVRVQMSFVEDQKTVTNYYTPYGCLAMGIDTRKIAINEGKDEIKVAVDYALEINEEHAADCDIQITIKSKK